MDLGNQKSIEELMEKITKEFGSVDILINNAVQWPSFNLKFEDISIEQWEAFLWTNLIRTIRLSQLFVPNMKVKRWGRIVFISSNLGIDSMNYRTLKSALFGLAANLFTELSEYKILTNIVMPSWTLTESKLSSSTEDFQKYKGRRCYCYGLLKTERLLSNLVNYLLKSNLPKTL